MIQLYALTTRSILNMKIAMKEIAQVCYMLEKKWNV